MHEKAVAIVDEQMDRFCKDVFDAYDRYKINGHIKRPNGK
jgi:hypothetical protein